MKTILTTGLLILCLGGLSACEQDGPLERAGEEIDEAAEDIRTDGQTIGNRLDDAVDDVRDGAEDAADELRR
jgi:predicted small lipoprotein YifL